MSHTRRELIEARLARVRVDLDEIVDRLNEGMLDWAPAAGMRTISGQLVEVIGTELQLVARLSEDRKISDPDARQIIGDCDSLENLRKSLIDTRSQTLKYLDTLSDQQLDEEIAFGGGWFGSLGLSAIPRAEVFVHVADHEWYHVGQLISYLWARGDDPYKW